MNEPKFIFFFAPFIYKFLNDFRKSSNFFVDGERPPKNCSNIKGFILHFDEKSRRRGGDRPPKMCSNIKGFILHFDENVQKMADFHQIVM